MPITSIRVWFTWALVLLSPIAHANPLDQPAEIVRPTIGTRKPSAKLPARRELPRKVLALFHSGEETSADATRIHKYLEMPLNHLGYHVAYVDLAAGLPKSSDLDGAVAVVTWFEDDIPGDEAYIAWATRTARAGMKFIVFEAVGVKSGPNEPALITPFLAELGLEPVDHWVADTSASTVTKLDPEIVGRERPLATPLPSHRYLKQADKRTAGAAARGTGPRREKVGANVATIASTAARELDIVLAASPPADLPGARGDVVLAAAGPRGGYVAAGYAINWDEATQRVWWTIDPIAFLERVLDAGARPIPDVTTLAGRRIYFSHVDGDSWNSRSQVAAHRGKSNAEVALLELLLPFPDLPVTVGAISCDVEPPRALATDGAAIARRIYALPHVEPASHSHTHPFDWGFFRSYSREREEALVAGLADPKLKLGSLPRYAVEKPFDLDLEIAGSLDKVTALSPPGKPARMFLWSGDTKPFEAAVAATRKAGVRNMNGGDTRYDAAWPSLAYVKPLSRPVGAERQLYAVNSNENTYTNEWTGPYDGFAKLVETHERTGAPRRLKPINVYYHLYSAEHDASLAAVKAHLERARHAPVIPISASRYAAIVDSFFAVRIVPDGALRWRIENRGALHTVRFDEGGLSVNFAQSVGVLGQNMANGSLYVALDPAVANPVVAVHLKPVRPPRAGRANVVESRWSLSSLESRPCSITARAEGFGRGEITLAGVDPGRYLADVVSDATGELVRTSGLIAQADGTLAMRLEGDARSGARVRISCAAN